MKPHRLLALLAWLLWLPAFAQTAAVQATLDRDSVQLGETVTLNLRADGGGSLGTPDLSPLQRDFDILGSSSNTSVSIVNGQRSAQTIVGIALRPKRAGRLEIPPLEVNGQRTAALSLQVSPADAAAAARGGKDVFMESAVEPGTVRVGQQLVYTVKLYYRATLTNGALADPQLPGVDVRRLGGDLDYDAERGGRNYHVVERRYALIPQRPGRLEIPALGFQGEQVDPNDPDSFFGMGTPVSAAAPAAAVEVQPAPADWGNAAWLPARQLELKLDGLPADGRARVGQPLNLTMTLQATGLPYEALPALGLPPLDGATVYPDKPAEATRADGQWLLGSRTQSFAVVPERPGRLRIPATTLKWWNVQSGRAETATIPARELDVLPAAGAGAAPAAAASSSAAPLPAAPASTAAPSSGAWTARLPGAGTWPWWLAGAAALLLAGALGWWLGRRGGRRAAPRESATAVVAPPARRLREAFLAAARGTDAAAQEQALLAWARSERPQLRNLGELADALAAPAQREAIAALQRQRYAGAPATAGTALAAAFVRGFAWRDGAGKDGDEPPLPPLYPFKLR
ncbi:BatD family protein [Fulvimonas soli]|uniref:Oxygen tolerance protein BatD n=1 Tax=Fulvimonas soli TaxID=155197 RepID=A0A316HU04_9GAMM|nr:BatD family protein [Fulvimonas soli]PWK83513.1 oxygen tolerance protein BatD [Fulvimonas soli]TNY25510.1 hypothetical protein BV497_13525 [Fulvimonas soli]